MQLSQILKTWRVNGGSIVVEFFGSLMTSGPILYTLPTALVYGPVIVVDASKGSNFSVTVTDNVAFMFANPTNPPGAGVGQSLSLTVRNASGGAHGAGTFDTAYKVSGNVAVIADGFNRTYAFQWNGASWVETYRSPADVPN